MAKSMSTADEYDFVDHDETALSPEVLNKIRSWLQPTDYLAESGEFRRHLLSQAPGTGLWICETEEYRRWHDSPDHGSLWIKGVPGAGKSVTAASIIQHLRTTEDCPVLFFFFRNIVAANFSPRALIQDWLAQLLPHSPKLQFALQARLETSLEETSDNDLIQIFLDGVSCVPKLYCVGDALDEMSTDNRPFLDKLNSLATYRPRSLKLLMTSRPKQYLQSALRDSSIVHVSLQRRLVDADIVSYLQHRFDGIPMSNERRSTRDSVIDMVARRSESLFLYAKLTMDQVEIALLSDGPVDLKVLEESLPVGLEETYTNVLAKQRKESGVDTDIQVLVLGAVTHASRPLRLNELAALLACVRPNVLAPAGFKALVTTCCGPLVEVLEDETLQVIHHSFTEFLRGEARNTTRTGGLSAFPVINSEEAQKQLALHCLQYLQSGSLLLENERSDPSASKWNIVFRTPVHQIDPDEEHYRRSHLGLKEERDPFNYREARLLHPFLAYAVENWPYHATRYDIQDHAFFAAVTAFLKPEDLSFQRWLVLRWGSTSNSKGSTDGMPTALHIAAFAGLSQLALELLQTGSPVSVVDAQERTPLHWAAFNGHNKVVSLLLKHGAEPNPEDGQGIKPIHLAARKNHASVVKLLLEAGVEPNTIKTKENHTGRLLGGETVTKGECAILYASRGGHTETLVEMIPFCKGKVLEQLLCECCRFGRTDAVLEILDRSDVSADAIYHEATALFFACRSADARSAEALIKRGADVKKISAWAPRRTINGGWSQKSSGHPPLHELVKSWKDANDLACQAILWMLVKAGADLEQLDGNKNTALIVACGTSKNSRNRVCLPALRGLLYGGANAKKIDEAGDSALHIVLGACRDPEAVRLLIEHGSDPNHRGKGGETVLQTALYNPGMMAGLENTGTVVEYLLQNGADPNLQDDRGNTAVLNGMSGGAEVFEMLLSRCNDNFVKRKCWFRLSSERSPERFAKCLELLLAEGIEIDTRAADGRTLYLNCLSSDEQLAILRRHGADPNATDAGGNNALHILCRGNSAMRILLEKRIANGVDPLATNNAGQTLLHHAAAWYNCDPRFADCLKWLVGLGIPVNAVDKKGSTAMHVYQSLNRPGTSVNHSERVSFLDALSAVGDLDFEIRDNDGLTVLHLAASRSEAQLATLAAAGANLGSLTSDSQNALHLACGAGKASIVGQILAQAGALDVNQKDRFGRTPLHYACFSANAESVAFLLKHGADVHAVDVDNSTPLHLCAEYQSKSNWSNRDRRYPWQQRPATGVEPGSYGLKRSREHWYKHQYGDRRYHMDGQLCPAVGTVAKMLIDAGCDAGAIDKYKFTALDVALRARCTEVIELFAQNETIFARAMEVTATDQGFVGREEKTKRARAQMLLLGPRSCLDVLGEDKPAFNEVLENPSRYLEILTDDDAAKLINDAFEANPLDGSYYRLVTHLLSHGHIRVSERIPRVLLQYGSHESSKERLARLRKTDECRYETRSLTTLQLACGQSESNMLTLQLLVEGLKVDVNAPMALVEGDSYTVSQVIVPGGTALHVLAAADHYWQVEALKYLLANGAEVDARDDHGHSPLHIAARGIDEKTQESQGFWRSAAVRVLLDHGADPNMLDRQSLTPLHKASAAPEIMRELLARGADAYAGGSNPLFEVIIGQNLAALEVLLDHGLSVDSLDEKRHSRDVHYSLTKGRKVYALLCTAFASKLNTHVPQSVPLLRALVRRGANLYLPLNDDETMIHFLFEFPEYLVLDTLLQDPCVARIDFNRRDQRGRTVLMAACDWVQALPGYFHLHWDPKATGPPLRILDLGADTTLVDKDGKTALHHLLDNPGMADDVLLQFIDRVEVAPTLFTKDNAGYTPLHYALRLLRPDVCELLLSKGADLHEPDPNGLTTLHYIADQWHTTTRSPGNSGRLTIDMPNDFFDQCHALWQRFLAKGGSINITDNAGNTPLHTYLLSAYKRADSKHTDPLVEPAPCHLAYYEKLFPPDSDVDIFAVNNDGETALHLITRNKHYKPAGHDKALFEAMMAKGLDPLKEDARGRSALDVASACEKDDIVALLGRK